MSKGNDEDSLTPSIRNPLATQFIMATKSLTSVFNAICASREYSTIFDLYFRWQDEKEYEDIKDYKKFLDARLKTVDPDITVKTLTRGWKFDIEVKDLGIIHAFIKKYRNGKVSVAATIAV